MKRVVSSLIGVIVCLVLAPAAHAAVAENTGPISFTGNQLYEWVLDIDFGATPMSIEFTLQLTCTQMPAGFRLEMYDVTRMSRATNDAEWGAGASIWDTNGPAPQVATFLLNNAAGGQPSYQSPPLSGVNRYIFLLSPSPNGTTPTAGTPQNLTLEVLAGVGTPPSTVAAVQHNWTTRPTGGGMGSVGSSQYYQRNYDGVSLMFADLGSAADILEFEFDVDFGGTPVQKSVSLFAAPSTGAGNAIYEVHVMGDGFESPAHIQLNVPTGTFQANTYLTSALSGNQKIRVRMRAGTGFSALMESVVFLTVESGAEMADALVEPRIGHPAMAITPTGAAPLTGTTSLTVSGGTPTVNYTWTTEGTVPAGVVLVGSTGPTVSLQVAGSTAQGAQVTVRASNGAVEFARETYTINAIFTPLSLTIPGGLPDGAEGLAYGPISPQVAGGTPPYTFGMTGAPTGLVIDPNTGEISGTPTQNGSFSITITVSDSDTPPGQASAGPFNITIYAAGVFVITTNGLPSGTQNQAYTATIASINGQGNHTWQVSSGVLPGGLSLQPSTGPTVQISGTPLVSGTFGPFTIQVTDQALPTAQTTSKSFTITLAPAGGGGGPGGGFGFGGGGGGGGCASGSGTAPWYGLLAMLGVAAMALRLRTRRQ